LSFEPAAVGRDLRPSRAGDLGPARAPQQAARLRPDVPDGDAFDPWRLGIPSRAEFAELGGPGASPSPRQLACLARFGLLAPTHRNSVPERFHLLDTGAMDVWLDRRAILPVSDPEGRQAVLSAGCAVANVAVAARSYGLWATVEPAFPEPEAMLPPRPGEPSLVRLARMRFEPGPEEPFDLLEAMFLRKVVRAEYDGRPLEASLARRLRGNAGYRHGIALHLIADPETLRLLGQLEVAAESIRFRREGFAAEMGRWLLPNDADAPLGVRGREMGLSDDVARQLHLVLAGPEQPAATVLAPFLADGGALMGSASAIGVLTVPRDDLPRRLDAGRAYEELALLLASEGYATSIHCAMTELAAPRLALRSRLETSERPVIIFRIGRPRRPEDGSRPHSARPPLEHVLVAGEVQ
jgi:hypothetical protein